MELTLADNIRAFRKERNLTQEQLAEVLGVTTGAVYKWEAKLSYPELTMIVEMADFFDTSVDVLLGYKMRENNIEASIHRISELCKVLDPTALTEAEKLLKKHPNSFEVVYSTAAVYYVYGAGEHNNEYLMRALELYEQARHLIGQNTNPVKGELSIWGDMAGIYIALREYEKGMEIMKKHNDMGVFNDSIGVVLAMTLNRPEEASEYLADSMLNSVITLLNTVLGYVFSFSAAKDYKSAEEILLWSLQVMDGLTQKDRTGYFDKILAETLILLAHARINLGKKKEAAMDISRAAGIAARFDSSPDFGISNVNFISAPECSNIHDALGATVSGSIEELIGFTGNKELEEMWRKR